MYKTIFGPVPSRRLGLSLGIDLTPHKTCAFDCVYCECGATTNLTITRENFIDSELVKSEISDFLKKNKNNLPEILTFSGGGEPTLAKNLGEIIDYIKSRTKIPVCVLTNSALIDRPDVQNDLLKTDIVIPSLDAVTPEIFKQIDRPHPSIKTNNIINGLIEFSAKFKGKLYVEILLIKGINDSPDELKKIAEIINKINVKAVQLNTLARPGTLSDLTPLTTEELYNAAAYFEVRVNITGNIQIAETTESDYSALFEMLLRRFCKYSDLKKTYGFKNQKEFEKILSSSNKNVIMHSQNNEQYYKLTE